MPNIWSVISLDSGGTFTDVIAVRDSEVLVFKTPSTPKAPDEAIRKAIQQTGKAKEIIHGTTVGTNTILERTGAKVVLITTEGFKDVLEIGRQNRSDIYSLYPTRSIPLVPAVRRLEVQERISATGEVLVPMSEEEVDRIKAEVSSLQPESVAICTLFSFLENSHELRLEEALRTLCPVSISSKVHPEYREYERTSTVVVDAYVKPKMKNYLERLEGFIEGDHWAELFAVMKSDRGLALSNSVSKRPVDTIFSGLAGGVEASIFASKLTGIRNLLAIDIGGTSTDVAAIIDGTNPLQQSQKIDGLPVARPAVDVVTIGAGGGSLVKYRLSGLISVGPESAGADPGPIAYDMGGEIPTVTDLDLVYGVLPTTLAGGALKLNRSKSEMALQKLANEMQLSLGETIVGVRRVFHENIAGAIRSVSTQRGYDPRSFTLLGFGGAGPVHAVEIADTLGMHQVLIPPYPGVWSSMGLLGADYQYIESKGLIQNYSSLSESDVNEVLDELNDKVMSKARNDGHDLLEYHLKSRVSLRFQGQSFELDVPFEGLAASREGFIELHRERYGFAAVDEPVELVAISAILVVPHSSPDLPKYVPTSDYLVSNREIIGIGQVPVVRKSGMRIRETYSGPMVIEQDDSTIWVPVGWGTEIDDFGFLHISKS